MLSAISELDIPTLERILMLYNSNVIHIQASTIES